MSQYFVYVLRSLEDKKRYVGISTDVARRLQEHNEGHVQSTKARIPFELVHCEEYPSRSEARKREKYFKTAAGRRFTHKIGS